MPFFVFVPEILPLYPRPEKNTFSKLLFSFTSPTMQYTLALAAASSALLTTSIVYASPAAAQITAAPQALARRQQPSPAGSSVLAKVMTIAAGESFDGGNAMFDRGVTCTGQEEGGSSDAVFILEKGASLSNVIIGELTRPNTC